MLCLAIDTSTPTVVTGLVRVTDDRVELVRDASLPQCRDHHERLIPAIQDCLKVAELHFSDVDAIIVGCGPGPFTGLRVGMATGAALGHALGRPVHGVVSHDAIAAEVYRLHPKARDILIATDARRREVYWARYSAGVRCGDPAVEAPATVSTEGMDVVNVPARIAMPIDESIPTADLAPTPVSLVECADLNEEPQPLTPLYLRRPDAIPPVPLPPSTALTSSSELGRQSLEQGRTRSDSNGCHHSGHSDTQGAQ